MGSSPQPFPDPSAHLPDRTSAAATSSNRASSPDIEALMGSEFREADASSEGAHGGPYEDTETEGSDTDSEASNWPEIDWDADKTMSTYLDILKKRGNLKLLEAIVASDENTSQVKDGSPLLPDASQGRKYALINGMLILTLMSSESKEHLIRGTMMREARQRTPAQVEEILPKQGAFDVKIQKQRGRPKKGAVKAATDTRPNRPCIYGLFHTDEYGVPPTKHQYEQILKGVEEYLDGHSAQWENRAPQTGQFDAFVAKVDGVVKTGGKKWVKDANTVRTMHRKGRRRYIENSSARASTEAWVSAMRQRLQRISSAHEHQPIPWEVSEIGFTINPMSRLLEHHAKHVNSNDLMNLIEAVAMVLINENETDTTKHFKMYSLILFDIPTRNCCEIAEHLISVLASSYAWQGGLNGVVGGNQVYPANDLVTDVRPARQTQVDLDPVRRRCVEEVEKLTEEWEAIKVIASAEENQNKSKLAATKLEKATKELEEASEQFKSGGKHMDEAAGKFLEKARLDVNGLHHANETEQMSAELLDMIREVRMLDTTAGGQTSSS